MKNWHITWEEGGRSMVATLRARDAEHAIRAWKRANPSLGVRAIHTVARMSR